MQDKKQRILDATVVLLARSGFHGFSMKQLAQQAEVAAGTVYLYFKNKEDLISQLHLQIISQASQFIFATHDENASLYTQYQQIWRSCWAFFQLNPDMVLSKNQFDHLPPEILLSQQANAQKQFAPLKTLFEKGRVEKVLKQLPDEVLVTLSIETCSMLARKQLLGLIDIDEELLTATVAASWDAIALKFETPKEVKV